MDPQVPQFDGVHHLKLPVGDLDRSSEWFGSRLGYATAMEFREDGKVMGLALNHPDCHEIRFYTTESHQKAPEGQVYIVDNARSAPNRPDLERSA